MPAEVEAKFRANSAEVLETLASAPTLGFAELGPPSTALEVDRYLDTADGRLAAVGWACRLRVRDGDARVSLKGPAVPTDGAWHHNRPEVEGPATESTDPADWPEGEARSMLLELAGGAPLIQATVLRQRRTERAVMVDGRSVATLSLDAVQVAGPEDRRLWIVELELADETSLDRQRLDELADALMRFGLRPDPESKLEHALRPAAG
jgi:inorganic triphosphatase YgiF